MSKVRELINELDHAEESQQKVELLCNLAWALKIEDSERAEQYASQALEHALLLKDKTRLCSIYTVLGILHKNKGSYVEANDYFFKIVDICKETGGNTPDLAGTYSNIGIVYSIQGEYSKASEYFFLALEIGEQFKSKKIISAACNNLGFLFELQNDSEAALMYHERSYNNSCETGDKRGMAYALNNSANVHRSEKEHSIALQKLLKAKVIILELNDKYGLGYSYCKIGEVHLEIGNYTIAQENLFKALRIQEEINDPSGQSETLKHISTIYIRQQKSTGALAFSRKSLELANRIGAKSKIMEAYKNLSESYLLVNKYRKAYEYYVHYIKVKEILFSEEKLKTINTLKSKFEAEKKDQKIIQLNNEQELLQAMNMELKQFANKAGHDLKEPIRMINRFSDQLQHKYKEVLDAQGLEFVEIIKNASSRMHNMLEDLLEYAVAGIKPKDLNMVNLMDTALIAKNNLYLLLKEKNATIEIGVLPTVLSSSTNMIQLFQNMISNGVKFHREGVDPVIKITAEETENSYTIYFQDNGIGIELDYQALVFDIFHRIHPKTKYEGTGIGLATCKKIIKNLGGTISLQSVPEKGSCFIVTFPTNPSLYLGQHHY